MPLVLELKPKERVVINGAVITNDGRRTRLSVENFAQIIREKDIMREREATTPARRVYFLAQCMLLGVTDTQSQDAYKTALDKAITDLDAALTRREVKAHLDSVRDLVDKQDFYKALIALKPVLDYEAQLLAIAGQ